MSSIERKGISREALVAAGFVTAVGIGAFIEQNDVFAKTEPIDEEYKVVSSEVREALNQPEEGVREELVTIHPTPIEITGLEVQNSSTFILEREVEVKKELSIADSFIYPIEDGKVTGRDYMDRYVNYREVEVFHAGEDWNWYPDVIGEEGITGFEDLGKEVLTIADAECVFAEDVGFGLGNVVIMKHLIEVEGEVRAVYSQYAHLNKINAEVGGVYDQGFILGEVGKTGDYEYPHLDFQIFNEWLFENYVLKYGPNFSLEDMNEEFLRKTHYHPTKFINFRNSLK